MAEDELHELSAPYALDALDDADRARFESHLETCASCREEVAAFRQTASALAYGEPAAAPPERLRAGILAAARAEPQNVVQLRPRRSPAAYLAAAVAVAATAAAVGLGLWAQHLHSSLGDERSVSRILKDPHARHIQLVGAPGELVVASSGAAVLNVALPKPAPGKTYEAWVAAPTVTRAAVFTASSVPLSLRVPPGARVMVTIEKRGGVDSPTHSPIVHAQA